MGALLNLIDFSKDAQICALASECLDLLLSAVLSFTTPTGQFFSVTGRGYLKHRCMGAGFDINAVIWLLVGAGNPDTPIKSAAAFLATSQYCKKDLSSILECWRNPLHLWHIGASVENMVIEVFLLFCSLFIPIF